MSSIGYVAGVKTKDYIEYNPTSKNLYKLQHKQNGSVKTPKPQIKAWLINKENMNEKTDVVSNLFYKLTPIAATHAQQNRARRLRTALRQVHAAQVPVSTQAATRTPLQERTAAGLPWPPVSEEMRVGLVFKASQPLCVLTNFL